MGDCRSGNATKSFQFWKCRICIWCWKLFSHCFFFCSPTYPENHPQIVQFALNQMKGEHFQCLPIGKVNWDINWKWNRSIFHVLAELLYQLQSIMLVDWPIEKLMQFLFLKLFLDAFPVILSDKKVQEFPLLCQSFPRGCFDGKNHRMLKIYRNKIHVILKCVPLKKMGAL